MQHNHLERILIDLDEDSEAISIINMLIKDNKLDNQTLTSIGEVIREEITKTTNQFERSKLQRSLDYVEKLRQEEAKEESNSDIDIELENQLHDL